MVQFKILFLIVTLFMLSACKIDRKDTVDRDKFSFRYTDETYLFFKNVRQIYYDFQDLPQARWHAYRFGDRYTGSDRPSLIPVIVVDWSKSEAYILVEFNEMLAVETAIQIRERNKNSGVYYGYQLRERGRENMLEFATKIYEGTMAQNDLSVSIDGEFIPLFQDDDEAESFRVVMADYYRLTRIF
jgi:hypothetical protein